MRSGNTLNELYAAFPERGHRTAVACGTRRATYQELHDRSRVVAAAVLALAPTPGTRIGILFPNDDRFVTSFVAITRVGLVAAPISTFSTAAELRQLVTKGRLGALVMADRYLSHDYRATLAEAFPAGDHPPVLWWPADVPQLAADSGPDGLHAVTEREGTVTPDTPAVVVHTSGSTSTPKSVEHSHGGLVRSGQRGALERRFVAESRVWTSMPFFWVGGLCTCVLAVYTAGGQVVSSLTTDPGEILDVFEREQVTYAMGWPHTAKALRSHESFPRRDLRHLNPDFIGQVDPALRPKDSVSMSLLGMTETAGPYTTWPAARMPLDMAGSFGVPAPGMEVRVVDIDTRAQSQRGELGEIEVRGDTLAILVDGVPPGDAEGWFRTGDLGSFRDGHLFFHGRTDNRIKTNGTNVAPAEVEAAIRAVRGVGFVHVTGVDRDGGQVVGAYIGRAHGSALDAVDVTAECRRSLSVYKVPKVIAIVDVGQVPMLPSGKPDLRELQRVLSAAR